MFETLRWTALGAELEVLSTQPSACLYFDPSNKPLVQAGQALFNTPTLLGGQAAKAGLSCASCHVNGRDNPHFMLAGVSDQRGTSDVTNSFFSATRGNGRFDPVPIPDLATSGKVSRDPETRALEPFIRMLIVDEFAGHQPSPAMLEALAAYVRSIRNCPGGDKNPIPRKLEDQLALTKAAMAGAVEMAERGDMTASGTMIAAARHQLGLISERYAGDALKAERAALLKVSRELQGLSNKTGDTQRFVKNLNGWISLFEERTSAQLKRKEGKSLYNPRNLTFVAPQRESR